LDRPLAARFFIDPEPHDSDSSARPEGHSISTGIEVFHRGNPVRDISELPAFTLRSLPEVAKVASEFTDAFRVTA